MSPEKPDYIEQLKEGFKEVLHFDIDALFGDDKSDTQHKSATVYTKQTLFRIPILKE